MGLFGGPVASFAEKFCAYLDERVEARYKEANATNDNWDKMKGLIIGEALAEVSAALKVIAGL